MKIKFVKGPAGIGFGYAVGEMLDCGKPFGKEMVELGYAIELEESTSNLPEDLPMREVLIDAGIDSIEALNEIATPESLTALKGIGKKSADNILKYLNK